MTTVLPTAASFTGEPPQSPAAIPTTGTARASRLLAEGAEPVPGGVFRYFAFGTGGQQVELTALPLSRTEAQRVVRIDVRLAAVGSLGDPAQGTTLLNQVHLRLADPDQPTSNPC